MKITRYHQSCILIETDTARILIDPSDFEAGRIDTLGRLDAVLYTHEHADHFDPELAQTLKEQGIAVYANESTNKQAESSLNVVDNYQEIKINDTTIVAIELLHCLLPDGSAGPQNTGYIIEDRFFHPGDGVYLEDFEASIVALPITGPDVSMKDAFDFALQLKAKEVIPIHFDKLGAHPEVFKGFADRFSMPFTVHPLTDGQSIDI